MWESILKKPITIGRTRIGMKPMPEDDDECITWLKGLYDIFQRNKEADNGHPYGYKIWDNMWNEVIPNVLACTIKEYLHTSDDIDNENSNWQAFSDWDNYAVYIKVEIYMADYIQYHISVENEEGGNRGIRMQINSSWTKALNNIEVMIKATKEILTYINRKDQFDWFVMYVKSHLENTDKLVELEDSGLLRW